MSTAIDGYGLIRQGNPVDAFRRRGAAYIGDVGSTSFDASSTAFLLFPNPVTGGVVIGSAIVWGGAEAWQHRKELGRAVGSAADWAWDHSAAGFAWNNRKEIGDALDHGVDFARETAKDIGHVLDHGVRAAEHSLSEVKHRAGDVGKRLVGDAGKVLDKITPW